MTKEELKSVNKSRQSKAGNFEPAIRNQSGVFGCQLNLYLILLIVRSVLVRLAAIIA